MDTRVMREIRLIVGLVPTPTRMPPQPFGKTQLTQLYSKINDKYDYGSFIFLPDGARIAHQEQDQILVQTGLIQFNEPVLVDFVPTKEKVIDLLRIIVEHLRLRQFLTLGIKLICHLPVSGTTKADKLLENRFLGLHEEQLKLLGPDRLGTGLRFHFSTQDSIWDLRVEPFFQDLEKLYVEMDKHYKQAFEGIQGVEAGIQSVRDYVFTEVRNLLESTL